MRRRFPSVLSLGLALVGAALSISCALDDPGDDAPTGELAAEICPTCLTPPIIDWVPGRVGPRELFPAGVRHHHTLMTQGDSERVVFAWGLGDGRPLWIFRVARTQLGDFTGALASGWMEREAPGGKTHSISGSVSSPPPRHPPHPGEPEFTRPYVEAVQASAIQHQVETDAILGDLRGL